MKDNKPKDTAPKTETVKVCHLNLDDLFTSGYIGGCYPENDIFGESNAGTCLPEDRDAYRVRFLDEMARKFDESCTTIKAVKETSPSGEVSYYRAED